MPKLTNKFNADEHAVAEVMRLVANGDPLQGAFAQGVGSLMARGIPAAKARDIAEAAIKRDNPGFVPIVPDDLFFLHF